MSRVSKSEWERRKTLVKQYLRKIDDNPMRSGEIRSSEVNEHVDLGRDTITQTMKRMDCLEINTMFSSERHNLYSIRSDKL